MEILLVIVVYTSVSASMMIRRKSIVNKCMRLGQFILLLVLTLTVNAKQSKPNNDGSDDDSALGGYSKQPSFNRNLVRDDSGSGGGSGHKSHFDSQDDGNDDDGAGISNGRQRISNPKGGRGESSDDDGQSHNSRKGAKHQYSDDRGQSGDSDRGGNERDRGLQQPDGNQKSGKGKDGQNGNGKESQGDGNDGSQDNGQPKKNGKDANRGNSNVDGQKTKIASNAPTPPATPMPPSSSSGKDDDDKKKKDDDDDSDSNKKKKKKKKDDDSSSSSDDDHKKHKKSKKNKEDEDPEENEDSTEVSSLSKSSKPLPEKPVVAPAPPEGKSNEKQKHKISTAQALMIAGTAVVGTGVLAAGISGAAIMSKKTKQKKAEAAQVKKIKRSDFIKNEQGLPKYRQGNHWYQTVVIPKPQDIKTAQDQAAHAQLLLLVKENKYLRAKDRQAQAKSFNRRLKAGEINSSLQRMGIDPYSFAKKFNVEIAPKPPS